MNRIYNFSAGPATLPESVLKEAQENLLNFHGAGFSIMEASHRGKEYDAVHHEAMDNIRKLLHIPDSYDILLLQGGATLQFAMVPLNLLGKGQTADYALTGSWSKKAFKEAQAVGDVQIACDTVSTVRIPELSEIQRSDNSVYFYLASNETISGCQWKMFPKLSTSLVADMSSDILSRPFPVEDFGLIFAGAQKNMGPAGVTVVILRKDLLDRVPEHVPAILRYKTHAENNSLYNTPPCFGIYILALTTRWLLNLGGIEAMHKMNIEKAALLYNAIDAGDFYTGTADLSCRSDMNVTFRLPSEELEAKFITEAGKKGMIGLKGHRSVGGIRASIYNAFPEHGVSALVDFMKDFQQSHV